MDNKGKLLIRRDEMVLIKNSQSAMNTDIYGNLYTCLQGYNSLSVGEFEGNKDFDNKAKAVILNNKSMLMDSITEEWMALACNEDETKKVHCQLCNTPNKYIYYIQNSNTDKELHVGSECIKKFPKVRNVKKIKKDLSESKRIKEEQRRRIEFQEMELPDLNFIREAEGKFDNIDILLPHELYIKIKEILYCLNTTKTNYIKNGGKKEEVFKIYNDAKKQFENLWKQALEFFNKNKNKKLVCRGKVAKWLHENKPEIWLEVSQNGGFFNENTLKNAYQKEYVEDHIEDFRKHLSEKDISIVGVTGAAIRFSIENNDYKYPLTFSIAYKDFMRNIGCFCICTSKYLYTRNDLANYKIDDNMLNFNSLYNRIRNIIRNIGFDIEVDENTETMYYKMLPREIKSNSKWSNKSRLSEAYYKKFERRQFFNICLPIIFKDDEEIEKVFKLVFNKLKNSKENWITEEDKRKYAELAAEAASRQKQREFIPYS